MVEFGADLAKRHTPSATSNFASATSKTRRSPRAASMSPSLNQALHHAISPAKAVAAAHRILKPGGRIAIIDLLAHRFEQARELYADLWLGFSEMDLRQFLDDSFKLPRHRSQRRRPRRENPQWQTVLATGIK